MQQLHPSYGSRPRGFLLFSALVSLALLHGAAAGSSTLLLARGSRRQAGTHLVAEIRRRRTTTPRPIGGLKLEPDADFENWHFEELPYPDDGALMEPLNGVEAVRRRVDIALNKTQGDMMAPAPASARQRRRRRRPSTSRRSPTPPPPPPPPGPEVCGQLLKAGADLPANEAFLDCTPFNWYGGSVQGPSSPWGCECSAWSVNCPFETCKNEQAWQEGCLESKVTQLGFTALSKTFLPLNGGVLPTGGYSNHPGMVSLCMYWLPQPPNPSFPIVAAPEWEEEYMAITPPPYPYSQEQLSASEGAASN